MKNEDCNGTREEKGSLSINGDGEERESTRYDCCQSNPAAGTLFGGAEMATSLHADWTYIV